MSTKWFCDACGNELDTDVVGTRIKGDHVIKGLRIMFEVHVGTDGTWNDGDLCAGCLAEALALSLPVEWLTNERCP